MKVVVAGKFDPLHAGHISMIRAAKNLGSQLIVIVQSDEVIKKLKGKVELTLGERVQSLMSLWAVNDICVAIDKDGTVTETLRKLKPDIFAKSGDRTPDNMPQSELDVCEELGIEIKYHVGDLYNSEGKLFSSTGLVQEGLDD